MSCIRTNIFISNKNVLDCATGTSNWGPNSRANRLLRAPAAVADRRLTPSSMHSELLVVSRAEPGQLVSIVFQGCQQPSKHLVFPSKNNMAAMCVSTSMFDAFGPLIVQGAYP